jgi:hypothetical protein
MLNRSHPCELVALPASQHAQGWCYPSRINVLSGSTYFTSCLSSSTLIIVSCRTSNMNQTPSFQLGRVVTACKECHRRKERCNRKRPCDMCIARNEDDKCNQAREKNEVKMLQPHLDPLTSTSSLKNKRKCHRSLKRQL